jgi:hypothetical protein
MLNPHINISAKYQVLSQGSQLTFLTGTPLAGRNTVICCDKCKAVFITLPVEMEREIPETSWDCSCKKQHTWKKRSSIPYR